VTAEDGVHTYCILNVNWGSYTRRLFVVTRAKKGGNMNTSGLIGKQVLDKNGNNVGKVADIDINFPQWTVNRLIVRTGIFKKTPIGIDRVDKVGDKIILKTA
jgi:sporulation protein YlmC with PRC-barrel domain